MTVPSSTTTPPPSSLFVFTMPGCRTELRLGALLVLAGTFLWNFVGPATAIKIAMIGAPLLLVGTVLQALCIGTRGGYPWKVCVAMLILGGAMCYDFRYREIPGGELAVVLVGPILAGAGAWLLVWWPVAVIRQRRAMAQVQAS